MAKSGGETKLDDRLIDFAVRIIRLAEALPKSAIGRHVAGQIVRSGTSPAANYGEALSAESRADFVHKMNICLKELRETRVWLHIIVRANLVKESRVTSVLDENDQLISIFVSSLKTARCNKKKTT